MESNLNLTGLVHEYTDAELLASRVETVRRICRLTDYLGMIDHERIIRAPLDQEAEIYQLGVAE